MWRLDFTEGKESVGQEGFLVAQIKPRQWTNCSLEEPSGTPGSAEFHPNGVKNIKSSALLGIAELEMTYQKYIYW